VTNFTSPQLNIATQVPIRRIEARSGLSFGRLANVDPLTGEEEGLDDGELPLLPLLSFGQIRFV
jgi:endonuclease G